MKTRNNKIIKNNKSKKNRPKGGFSMGSMLPTKTLSDFSRKKDKYGEIPFIVFYCVVLSRLAYLPDQGFIKSYSNIFGPIIPEESLSYISKKATSEPLQFINDISYKYELNDYAPKINSTIQKVENQLLKKTENISFSKDKKEINGNIKHISIAWSKYGEIYVVTDKRCPNIIFVNFRGTYSAATARIYSKLRSAKPVKLNNTDDVGVLYGIFKATCQLLHTIIESMKTLHTAQGFNKSRVITTGHSLGGGMTTFFASLFYEAMNQKEYSSYPFYSKPVCVSVASPLVVDKKASNMYCKLVEQQQIYFKKLATRGDPVIMIPKLGFYSHICSHSDSDSLKLNGKMAKRAINLHCNNTMNSLVMSSVSGIGSKMFSKKDNNEASRVLDKATVNYNANVDCLDEKGRKYVVNPISHTIYLNISFITGVDISQFASGMVSSTTKEISYDKSITRYGESVCRIIYGESNASNKEQNEMKSFMKIAFFKFNEMLNDSMKKVQLKEREKEDKDKDNKDDENENIAELNNSPPASSSKLTPQDIYMTSSNFSSLINNHSKILNKEHFIEKGQGPKNFADNNFKELYDKFNKSINKSESKPIIKGNLKKYEQSGGKGVSKCNKITNKKKYSKRGSPPYSASKCARGTRKKGNNGKLYVVKATSKGVNRWVPVVSKRK